MPQVPRPCQHKPRLGPPDPAGPQKGRMSTRFTSKGDTLGRAWARGRPPGPPARWGGGHRLDAPTVALGPWPHPCPPAARPPALPSRSRASHGSCGSDCFSPPDALPRLPPAWGREPSSASALAIILFLLPLSSPSGPASVIKPRGLPLRLIGLRAGPSDESGRHSLSLTLRRNPLMHGINHRCQALRPRAQAPAQRRPERGQGAAAGRTLQTDPTRPPPPPAPHISGPPRGPLRGSVSSG